MADGAFFKKHTRTIFHIFITILVILFIINTFYILNISQELQQKQLEAEEASRPAVLQTILLTTDCEDCSEELGDLSKFDVETERKVDGTTQEGQTLIEKYSITKLPALIITGELEKAGLHLEQREDAVVIEQLIPPYYDLQDKEIKGIVTATIITANNCRECFSLDPFITSLKNEVFVKEVITLDENEGRNLFTEYNISKLPSLLVSKEAMDYPGFQTLWSRLGQIHKDGTFIFNNPNPPYKDLATNNILGLVTVTYISDETCEACYDVKNHALILKNSFGVYLQEEKELDIKEAQSLISKYKITKVPTILLSKEINHYNIQPVMSQVGTYEDDETFVFRQVELMGTYKDLTTEKVVEAPQQEA